MFEKRLLFLTKDLLTVYPWQGGGVSGPPQRFEVTEAGRAGLVEFLLATPKIPLHVLVDLVEEEFRTETQPYVLGPDRKVLVERRLNRAFSTTPFRRLSFQGRETKPGRKDAVTLLSGITDPDLVLPWVECLREHGLLLVGIYSLPMVCSRLLKVLDVVTPATLMVSWQSTSGLRFSFYSGQHLKMSRMAPVPGQDPESYAKLFVTELERTKGYLHSLRLVPQGSCIRVILFTSPEMLDAVRPLCQESASIGFDLMTVNVVAGKLGIKRQITTPFSDSLFIQMLGALRPENHYANADMTRAYYSWLVKNILYVASVVWIIVAMAVGGWNMAEGFGLRGQWQAKARQLTEVQAQYRAAVDQALPVKTNPNDVRVTVQILEHIKNMGRGPAAVMQELSRQLAGFGHLRLDSLTWKGPMHPGTLGLLERKSGHRGLSEHRVVEGEQAKPKTALTPTDILEVVEFKGTVDDVKGDMAHALDHVYKFMAALLGNPEVYQVDPVEVPKNVEKEDVLEGDLTQMKKDIVDSVPFAFHVIFRRNPVEREH
ncbi:MAG: hypothetical protein HW380_271 [Magnetococcales bacterium]|nr:hypothetical protein [Magnetococcales bacterium]HIJ84342.1 hypothetical protein [Magnetococcales bacterium]